MEEKKKPRSKWRGLMPAAVWFLMFMFTAAKTDGCDAAEAAVLWLVFIAGCAARVVILMEEEHVEDYKRDNQ